MSRTNQVFSLDVRLQNELVGQLLRLPNDRYEFYFDDAYAAREDRPVLSLGMIGPSGELVPPRSTASKLPPFFSNLLPEGAYREMVAQMIGVHPDQEFFLLWTLGVDMAGAVTASEPHLDDLPSDFRGHVPEEFRLRIAIAGAQRKLFANDRIDLAPGVKATFRATYKGQNDFIVKIPSARYQHLVANEYSMMKFAAEAGIEIPEVEIVPLDDVENVPLNLVSEKEVLLVRRYDRVNGVKIHQEDFAQIFNQFAVDKYKDRSYANIAAVINHFAGEEQMKEFIRRLVFNVFIGNGDMHLKNWSFVYPDGRTPVLAPAYDYVSTLTYLPGDAMGLKVGSVKSFEKIDLDSFRRLAKRARLPEGVVAQEALGMAEKLRDIWPAFRDNSGLDQSITGAIDQHLDRVPLLQAPPLAPIRTV